MLVNLIKTYMTAVKKAVKKAVVKKDVPEVAQPTVETPHVSLPRVEYFEGKKVISSITVDGVRDITVEGGITYRVNV